MEHSAFSGLVVRAEKEGDYYCPICHKTVHLQQGQPVPLCCGKRMELLG